MTLAIYLRYSSENQRDNLSLAMQREACARLADQQFAGWTRREIRDEAETGLQNDRPGYQALLAAARAHEIGAVLVYKYDRLGRSQIDQLLCMEELEEKLGVQVWSATEPRDNVVRGILSVIAEFESRKLGQRLRDAGREAVRQGFSFGRAPFGYVNERVPVGGRTRAKFRIDPERAPIVVEIFEAYARGQSYRQIVYGMNARGVQAPGGGTWDISALHTILHNQAYLGRQIRGRIDRRELRDGTCRNVVQPQEAWVVTEDAHEPIIGRELWDRVQSIISSRNPAVVGRGRTPRYMLSGILRCECGASFVATSTLTRGRRYWTYHCGAHRSRGPAVCRNDHRLSGRWIESELVGRIMGEAQISDDEIREAIAAAMGSQPDSEAPDRDLSEIERRIARANRLVMECPEDAVAGIKDELIRLVERRRVIRSRAEADPEPDADGIFREMRSRLTRLQDALAGRDVSATRTALAGILDRAVVASDGSIRVEGDLFGCVYSKRGRGEPHSIPTSQPTVRARFGIVMAAAV